MAKLRTNPDNTRQLTTGPGYRYLLATDGPCPCCEGEPPPPGEFYAAKPCDACGDDSITVWVQATNSSGDWIFDPYPDRECLYFRLEPPWPGFGCFYIHREDATHELDPGPLNYLTGEHVKPDIFSCCQCCVDECLSTHHGTPSLWSALAAWRDYVNVHGTSVVIGPPDCCCDIYDSMYTFNLLWYHKQWQGTSTTCPNMRPIQDFRVVGRWTGTAGRVRAYVWDEIDGGWTDENATGIAHAADQSCTYYPTAAFETVNGYNYQLNSLGPLFTAGTITVHRAAASISCNSLRVISDIEMQNPDARNCGRAYHQLIFEWLYTGPDSCLEECDRTTPGPRKKPRPQPPGGEVQPIGVQPILGPP